MIHKLNYKILHLHLIRCKSFALNSPQSWHRLACRHSLTIVCELFIKYIIYKYLISFGSRSAPSRSAPSRLLHWRSRQWGLRVEPLPVDAYQLRRTLSSLIAVPCALSLGFPRPVLRLPSPLLLARLSLVVSSTLPWTLPTASRPRSSSGPRDSPSRRSREILLAATSSAASALRAVSSAPQPSFLFAEGSTSVRALVARPRTPRLASTAERAERFTVSRPMSFLVIGASTPGLLPRE